MIRDPELQALREIALAAGRLQRSAAGEVRRIDYKAANDMVTDLDRRVEELVLERLAAAFPGDAVAAEEGSARRGGSGRTWLVDPLDGTTNYVHGHPAYAVSLACRDDAGDLLAAVHAPALGELYLARRGAGAWREDLAAGTPPRPLRREADVPLDRALLATGFPYVRDRLVDRNARVVAAVLRRGCHGVRRCGSAALDLCWLGAGRLDGYWEWSLRPWDVAAGSLVAREAGVTVTDMDGRGGPLDGRHVVAGVGALHGTLLALVREVTADDAEA